MSTLRDDLLPLIDDLRGIAGDLGFRGYAVYVRQTAWPGKALAGGTPTITETRLLVGGQDPKVREVHRKDVVLGMPESHDVEYDIGPLTPKFPGGGVDLTLLSPSIGAQEIEISFVLKGEGLPPTGLLCKRVEDHLDRSLRIMIRVKGMGRARPATP